MTSNVSIVLPVLNEAESLPHVFAAIAAQTVSPREVICVDGGSTDGSAAMVRDIAAAGCARYDIRLVINPGGMPGANRNVGIDAACGEWIAFLDAGVLPAGTWLEQLIDCASTRDLKGVYGICCFDATTAFQRAVCAVSYGCGGVHPVLPASLFHKSVFSSVGLFRPDLRAGEDVLWLRAYERMFGPRAVCAAAITRYDRFPSSPSSLVRKWWTYERHTIIAGLHSRTRSLAISLVVLTLLAAFMLRPLMILAIAVTVVIVRGIVVPGRRSAHWNWWRPTPSAVLVAIGVCFLRDATKLAAQLGRLWPSRRHDGAVMQP